MSVTVCPAQMEVELTVTAGEGFTDTMAVAVFVHPAEVPVTE